MDVMSINELYAVYKAKNPNSRLSLQAIRNAVDNGEMYAVRSGNRAYVSEKALDDWLMGRSYE